MPDFDTRHREGHFFEDDGQIPSPDCSSNPCDNCFEHGPNGEHCSTLDYCPIHDEPDFPPGSVQGYYP